MSVPKFYEFFKEFLVTLEDGEIHSAKDMRLSIANSMQLSTEDLAEMLPSGKQTTFANRVAWARTYLNKAGLIVTPMRGRYQITEAGRKALDSGKTIDLDYLDSIEGFKEFRTAESDGNRIQTQNHAEEQIEKEESPMEILDAAFRQVNNTLAAELMDQIMNLTPADFEALVVKLLLKMGYGSGIDDAGIVTQKSNDGGIDGIIKEDQLGFSSIYIQAKQWSPDRTIDRPEIQRFAGALQEQKAQKGLFISTASFTSGAKRSAEAAGIVLVDGNQLTKLMIKFGLGVSIEHVYEVKRIDSDFFIDGF